MIDHHPIYYPSGKPFCYYEDNKQIILEANGNRIEIFLDDYGRNTGEYAAYNSADDLIKAKTFYPDSDDAGLISTYDWDGELTSIEYFKIMKSLHKEYIYVQNRGIRRKSSIRKLDPETNSISLCIDLFASGNRRAIIPQIRSLHDGEATAFYDHPDHPVQQINWFKDGIKKYTRMHHMNGTVRNEIVWDDPSIGNFTSLLYETVVHEGDKETLCVFKENVMVEKDIYIDELLLNSLYQDERNKQVFKVYHYNSHNRQIGETFYKAIEWDENKDMVRGTAFNYQYGRLCGNYDFKRHGDRFIQHGLSVKEVDFEFPQNPEFTILNPGIIEMYKMGKRTKQQEAFIEIDSNTETLCGNTLLLSRRSNNLIP